MHNINLLLFFWSHSLDGNSKRKALASSFFELELICTLQQNSWNGIWYPRWRKLKNMLSSDRLSKYYPISTGKDTQKQLHPASSRNLKTGKAHLCFKTWYLSIKATKPSGWYINDIMASSTPTILAITCSQRLFSWYVPNQQWQINLAFSAPI